MIKYIISFLICSFFVYADSNIDELFDSFDDSTNSTDQVLQSDVGKSLDNSLLNSISGKLSQYMYYSYRGDYPHDDITSLKTLLFMDFDYTFDTGWRIKANVNAYHDSIYGRYDRGFTSQEKDEFEKEIELFDAFIEGKITDSLDIKFGRQVVVWGRSDTIRVTDILNPLDSRRPGVVDIEYLRLPVTMCKFDYYIDDWQITPIVIMEQRFSKLPPFGSALYPGDQPLPESKDYADLTYALSVRRDFSGWDISFYAAQVRDDNGVLELMPKPQLEHYKIDMLGAAVNLIYGSFLFKTEFAYLDGLKFLSVDDSDFSRFDSLIGFEFSGIDNLVISYDFALRYFNDYDSRLLNETYPLEKDNYEHALRVAFSMLNDTLSINYMYYFFGLNMDNGGYQRVWLEYDMSDHVSVNLGVVDYLGGVPMFDAIENADMIFSDLTYNF